MPKHRRSPYLPPFYIPDMDEGGLRRRGFIRMVGGVPVILPRARASSPDMEVDASLVDDQIDPDDWTRLEVTVTNTGNEALERVMPTVYADGTESHLEEIERVPVGESRTVEAPIQPESEEGEFTLEVEVVDIDRNEASDTVSLTVGDVTPELELRAVDQTYKPGERIRMAFEVENKGGATAEAGIYFPDDKVRELRGDFGATQYEDRDDDGGGWDGFWFGREISPGETAEPWIGYDVYEDAEPRVVEIEAELYLGESGWLDDKDPIDDAVLRFTPEDTETTVMLTQYAVEVGQQSPSAIVETVADSVSVTTDRSETATELTQVDDNRWLGEVPVDDEPEVGDFVDVEVTVSSGEEEEVVTSIDNRYVLEDASLGFHVVQNVMDVGVLVGGFDDEAEVSAEEAEAWYTARGHDVNRHLASERGSMGAVGFDFGFVDRSGELLELEERNYYTREVDDGIDAVFDDIEEEAREMGFDFDEFDFWVATHPGESVEMEDSEGTAGRWVCDGGLTGASEKVYAGMAYSDERTGGYDAWIHELLHACGLEHLNEYGNVDSGKCVMGSHNREGEGVEALNPTAPLSSGLRIAESLGMGLDGCIPQVFGDWFEVDETSLEDAEGETVEVELEPLKSMEIGDETKVLTYRNTTYVFELRRHLGDDADRFGYWEEGERAVVVYRHQTQDDSLFGIRPWGGEPEDGHAYNYVTEEIEDELGDRRYLTDAEDAGDGEWVIRDSVDDFELVFRLDSISDEGAVVEVDVEAPNSKRAVLNDRTTIPNDVEVPCVEGDEVTPPSLSLKARDSEGRVVGFEDGEYVVGIPGARASGRRPRGTEWILVPADAEVEFSVSSHEVERFAEDLEEAGVVEDAEAFAREMGTEYEVAVSEYDDDAEVFVSDEGEVRVSGAETVFGGFEAEPGRETAVEEDELEEVARGEGDPETGVEAEGGRLARLATLAGGGAVGAGIAYLVYRMVYEG